MQITHAHDSLYVCVLCPDVLGDRAVMNGGDESLYLCICISVCHRLCSIYANPKPSGYPQIRVNKRMLTVSHSICVLFALEKISLPLFPPNRVNRVPFRRKLSWSTNDRDSYNPDENVGSDRTIRNPVGVYSLLRLGTYEDANLQLDYEGSIRQ